MVERKGCIRPDSNIALNSNIKRQRIDSKRSGKKQDDPKWMAPIKFQFSYRTEQKRNRKKAKAKREKIACVFVVRLLFVCAHIKPTTQSKLVVFTLVLRSHCMHTVYSSRVLLFESLQVRCFSHVVVIVVAVHWQTHFYFYFYFFFFPSCQCSLNYFSQHMKMPEFDSIIIILS